MEFRSVIVNDDFAKLLGLCGKGLHRELKSSFDHWRSLDEKSKVEYQPQVVVPLASPHTEEIGDEIKKLRKIYR